MAVANWSNKWKMTNAEIGRVRQPTTCGADAGSDDSRQQLICWCFLFWCWMSGLSTSRRHPSFRKCKIVTHAKSVQSCSGVCCRVSNLFVFLYFSVAIYILCIVDPFGEDEISKWPSEVCWLIWHFNCKSMRYCVCWPLVAVCQCPRPGGAAQPLSRGKCLLHHSWADQQRR